MHGDDDQIVPIGASALLSSKIVKGATLKIYPGAPHGLPSTHKEQVNEELLAFVKAPAAGTAALAEVGGYAVRKVCKGKSLVMRGDEMVPPGNPRTAVRRLANA